MKKILALALALIMALSMASVAFAAITLPTPNSAGDVHFTSSVEYDLNGETLTLDGDITYVINTDTEVVFKNGTINISAVNLSGSRSLFNLMGDNAVLTLNNVDVIGEGFVAGNAVFNLPMITGATTSTLNIINGSKIDLKNTASNEYVISGNNGSLAKINITNSTIKADNLRSGFVNGNYTINNSDIIMTNMRDNGINSNPGLFEMTINNSTLSIDTTGRALTLDMDTTLAIENNSKVSLSGTEADIKFNNRNNLDSTSGSENGAIAIDETVVLNAESVTVGNLIGTNADTIAQGLISREGEPVFANAAALASGVSIIPTYNPGETIVVDDDIDRTAYKVKSYDFTTGSRGFQGASYIDEIKIDKNNDLIIVLKNNYKLAEDKTIKGEIVLVNKSDRNDTAEISVEYIVKNNVEEISGAKKAADAGDYEIIPAPNAMYVMDEDGGYVYFEEETLSGVVKMNKEEKAFLNIWYGYIEEVTEDSIDAFEAFVGEDYIDEAIIEYYTFETRAFKNEVSFAFDAWEDDPHYFYLWDGEKLSAIDAKYDDDEDVEAYVWTGLAEGTIIVTDVEIVLAAEETSKNPNTGASDVVGMASALAVVSLVAVGAISLKK